MRNIFENSFDPPLEFMKLPICGIWFSKDFELLKMLFKSNSKESLRSSNKFRSNTLLLNFVKADSYSLRLSGKSDSQCCAYSTNVTFNVSELTEPN